MSKSNPKTHPWSAPPETLKAKWKDDWDPDPWEITAEEGIRILICQACHLCGEKDNPRLYDEREKYTSEDAARYIKSRWAGYLLSTGWTPYLRNYTTPCEWCGAPFEGERHQAAAWKKTRSKRV